MQEEISPGANFFPAVSSPDVSSDDTADAKSAVTIARRCESGGQKMAVSRQLLSTATARADAVDSEADAPYTALRHTP